MKKLIILFFCYSLGLSIIQAHPGIGIVMDSKGNVFYTDLTHVWKISADGERSIAVRNVHTHELYIDVQDNLYGEHEWYEGEATDKWGNHVWCLANDGVLKKTNPDVEGFLDNNTLVRDIEGNSHWAKKSADHEILMKQNVDGQNVEFTQHHFDDIRWMYYSKDDKNLYVVDQLKIKKVTPSGKVKIVADGLKEDSPPFEGVADRHYVFGLWTDSNNNLYTALYGAGKVKKFCANGDKLTVFESPEGWSPCGGMVAPDGSLWIMEFSDKNTIRIRKINPDGSHELFED